VVPTRLAELKACSKPFPDIPRIFALSRPTGAKGGAAAGCRRKFRESFPPLCSDGRGKLAGWRVTFAVLASRFARVFENLLRPFVESGGRSASNQGEAIILGVSPYCAPTFQTRVSRLTQGISISWPPEALPMR
jgi:hypothetical protein